MEVVSVGLFWDSPGSLELSEVRYRYVGTGRCHAIERPEGVSHCGAIGSSEVPYT